MSKHITHFRKFYEWCDEDLWGILALSVTNNRLLSYFYKSFQTNPKKRILAKKKLFKSTNNRFTKRYNIKFLYEFNTKDREFKRKKRRFRSKQHFTLFKLRTFYGNLRLHTLKNLLAGNKRNQNLWAGASTLLLEGRLDILLYRTGLFKSIFFVKQFVRHQGVLINGVPTTRCNQKLTVGDVIIIPKTFYDEFYEKFICRLKRRRILTNTPPYVEFNYRIGSFALTASPKGGEVAYPFRVSARFHWFSK